MASLLGLPRELRLLILEHALNGECEAPSLPSTSNRTEIHAWGHQDSSVTDPIAPKIYEEKQDARLAPNCGTLLSINHQISTEIQRLLDAGQATTVFKIDIAVLEEYRLFPTWLSIEGPANRVSTLHVNVRLFGYSPLCNGVGDPSRGSWFQPVDWGFSACLSRFFLYGPEGEENVNPRLSSDKHHSLTVDTLIINFSSHEHELPFPPSEITEDKRMKWMTGIPRRVFTGTEGRYKTPPQWFGDWIASIMIECEDDWLDDWEWLFSQVGRVKFLVEGKPLADLDTLKGLTKFSPKIQKKIIKRRKGLRLPVPEDQGVLERDSE